MLIFSFSGPDVIPLKHYGKCEVLGKIGNMEAKYDEPMHFDPDLLPTSSRATGDELQAWAVGLWGGSGRQAKEEQGKVDPYIGGSTVWVQRWQGVACSEAVPLLASEIPVGCSESCFVHCLGIGVR